MSFETEIKEINPDKLDVSSVKHHIPKGFSDHFAYGLTKSMRFMADKFFSGRYGHRAVILETVAGVPGMVGGTLQHLTSVVLQKAKMQSRWLVLTKRSQRQLKPN